ncbi:MAG: serine hydrolase [candidate division Zixibacteria bacterium]|nr:serine hydrolase [candidate division Zixibacteria bacterium]
MRKRIVRTLCFLIILSFLFTPLSAKKKTPEAYLKGLDKFITERMEEWNVPGLALSVIQDGRLIYSKGFGSRDVEQNLPVTPQTLFAIGSCTKAFTAVTMGMLVDEGQLEWDRPLREYLPTFKLKDSFATERMTPRDLVCHRSGLPRHDSMWYNSSASRKELFDRLQYLEPSKDFRTTYQYQNLMFMTAGYLVGQIAGTSWERFVRNRIFMPLGMTNSNFSVNDSQKALDFALPYREKDNKIIQIPFRNIDTVGPAGSINSNVTDMANWILLNLSKGKIGDQQVVSESSLKEIHSPQMISSKSYRYDESFYSMYGMGWGITSYRGHLRLSHGGGIDGFTAQVVLLPRDNIGMVILTNRSGTVLPSIISNNVADRLLGLDQIDWNSRIKKQVEEGEEEAEKAKKEKDKDRKLNTKPSHPLEDYAGDYEHPGYGVISFVIKNDQMNAEYNSIPYTASHYHYDVFEINNEMMDEALKVSFFTDLKGNIRSLSVQLEDAVEPIVFTKMPEKAMMEKSFLEKFTGEYVIGEEKSTVFLKGEKTLYLFVPGQPEYELVPYKGTTFNFKTLSGFSIEFIMDESGKVTEAKITQPNGVFTAKKIK